MAALFEDGLSQDLPFGDLWDDDADLDGDMADGTFEIQAPRARQPDPAPAVDWRCWRCDSEEIVHDPHGSGWHCAACLSTEYYRADVAQRREMQRGIWMYFPRQDTSMPPPSTQSPTQRTPGHRESPGPPDGSVPSEAAESEVPTNDPIVDPFNLQPAGSPGRRRRRRPDTTTTPPTEDPIQQLTKAIQALQDKKPTSTSTSSWDSRMGPAKNIRFRSGQAPLPPQWRYSREDVRAFPKWLRKVDLWKLQITSFMPRNEAAMMLYTSLQGEAEEEAEYLDLEKVNSSNGIDYIIEALTMQGLAEQGHLPEEEAVGGLWERRCGFLSIATADAREPSRR